MQTPGVRRKRNIIMMHTQIGQTVRDFWFDTETSIIVCILLFYIIFKRQYYMEQINDTVNIKYVSPYTIFDMLITGVYGSFLVCKI